MSCYAAVRASFRCCALHFVTHLQLFVPLLSPHVAPAASSSGGSHADSASSPFSLLQEVILRQAGGLTGEDVERGMGQPLEQLGLALTFGRSSAFLVCVIMANQQSRLKACRKRHACKCKTGAPGVIRT